MPTEDHFTLPLAVDPGRPGTLRGQLEDGLRDAVRRGRLRTGTRLPSTRALADDLGVSRGVVVEAYAQLVAEGYLAARRGSGTVVAPAPTGDRQAPGPARVPAAAIRYELRPGHPDLGAFPRRAWGQAMSRALREAPDALLGYGDPRGVQALRDELASYLGRVRGVVVDPDCVVVTSGTRHGLQLLWGAARDHGIRRVAVEDPGWRMQAVTVRAAGMEPVPIPVDDDGIDVDAVAAAGVDAVIVTPAHQFPLGVVLSPARRAALLDWARGTGAVIVEDDYDAEHRFDRKPIGSLQGLAPELVAYAGSASKTLAPALRIGWMVLPRPLVAGVASQRELSDNGGPPLDQLAFATLLERGELDRHLRRLRPQYRARRAAVVEALATALPECRVSGIAAGLHAVVELPLDVDEAAVTALLGERGVAVQGVAEHGAGRRRPPAVVIGYAGLPEAALRRAVGELARAVREVQAPARG